jgi:hypothetical protein
MKSKPNKFMPKIYVNTKFFPYKQKTKEFFNVIKHNKFISLINHPAWTHMQKRINLMLNCYGLFDSVWN